MIRYLKRAIRRWAFPSYACEWCACSPQECNGVCYCARHGAVAPGVGPGKFRAWVQGWAA